MFRVVPANAHDQLNRCDRHMRHALREFPDPVGFKVLRRSDEAAQRVDAGAGEVGQLFDVFLPLATRQLAVAIDMRTNEIEPLRDRPRTRLARYSFFPRCSFGFGCDHRMCVSSIENRTTINYVR